jgi:hypothetical protein
LKTLEGRDLAGDFGIGEGLILKRSVKEYMVRMWTGYL